MTGALVLMILIGASAVVARLVRSIEARLREAEGEGAGPVSEPASSPRAAPPQSAPPPRLRPVSCRGPR